MPHLGPLSTHMCLFLEHEQVARAWAKCLRFRLLYHMRCSVSPSIQQTQSLAVFGCAWVCVGPAQVEAIGAAFGQISANMGVLLEHGQVLGRVRWQVLNL